MHGVNVSVILPKVSDKSKFSRFCTSLFSSELNIELLVCEEVDSQIFPETYGEKIKIIKSENGAAALSAAVNAANGDFLMFSDVSVVLAPNAIEKMIVASRGRAAAANVGFAEGGESKKAFCSGFTFDELAGSAVYFNHLISTDVVRGNSIEFCGSDSLSLMLFLSDYYRYDTCCTVAEVLFYSDEKAKFAVDEALIYLKQYAEIFKSTANPNATLFFLRAVFSALLSDLNAQSFAVLKDIAAIFADDYLTISWIKNTFLIDVYSLIDPSTLYEDFKYSGTSVYYKEVTLPVAPDSVVKNFYFGKFGIDVLKKCIGAWGYYKFYRRKDDFIKKFGCKFFKKLLGGDFDA